MNNRDIIIIISWFVWSIIIGIVSRPDFVSCVGVVAVVVGFEWSEILHFCFSIKKKKLENNLNKLSEKKNLQIKVQNIY